MAPYQLITDRFGLRPGLNEFKSMFISPLFGMIGRQSNSFMLTPWQGTTGISHQIPRTFQQIKIRKYHLLPLMANFNFFQSYLILNLLPLYDLTELPACRYHNKTRVRW